MAYDSKIHSRGKGKEKEGLRVEELKKKKIESWKYLTAKELEEIMKNEKETEKMIIIDVRSEKKDWIGGNIKGSINISFEIFLSKIEEIINLYNNKKYIIIHCMHSKCRAPHIATWYCSIIQHLFKIYNKNRFTSSIWKKKNNNDCDNNSNNILDLSKINLSYSQYQNLLLQKVFVLQSGFHGWINDHFKLCYPSSDPYHHPFISNFHPNMWVITQDHSLQFHFTHITE
ncbi:hypothetical protein RFI_21677 [Reticulomyxa filosa]|uniref:Rhodanese domain-containing protein n=1 Tax=Reticulomyxa filosa TaxID=46433 RepID=X6MNW1_RETFI|nr:hypothetical protein RFI_21677 [Reticulomyxa filosa]|eukprot:ETO15688.1 hypothetical protein RFI_21677 [Reticulomyxa filosa]